MSLETVVFLVYPEIKYEGPMLEHRGVRAFTDVDEAQKYMCDMKDKETATDIEWEMTEIVMRIKM